MKDDIYRTNPPINAMDFGVPQLFVERAENYTRWAVASEREAAKNEERADCAALCKEIAEESDAFTRDILIMVAGLIEARGRDPMPLFSDWPGGVK